MFPLLPRGVNSEAVIYACCLSQFEQVLHKWHTHSLTYLCEMSAAFRNNEAVNFPNFYSLRQKQTRNLRRFSSLTRTLKVTMKA